jgi:ubiquinone/menaquinone biosynthesis C-methylase UbiE/uncharacterized protein YbaR (Trm112 family)
MSRISLAEVVEKQYLYCPRCHQSLSLLSKDEIQELRCDGCGSNYPVAGGIPLLVPDGDGKTAEIQKFWGALYDDAYREHDENASSDEFNTLLDKLRELFTHRRHLAAVEMSPDQLKGKKILEVGCGAGAHSALFSRLGAEMYALDLTAERVTATAVKLDMLNGGHSNFALQGDAGALPFADGFFDIVYSNGVLHHTPYIARTVKEIHRVLKPGGRAVVMLYAKNSFLYRCVLFPVRGILQGGVFRNGDWLGRATEWMSSKKQRVYNPRTEVFSALEIRALFKDYPSVHIRKNSFVFDQIPIVGKWIGRRAGIKTGHNDGGKLVYGHPWRNETAFELWAGRFIGFCLNILATK